MARFLKEQDYSMQVKTEIIKLLTEPTEWFNSTKLVRAEKTAISQIRNRIAKRYNCDIVFAPIATSIQSASDDDTRDQFIITLVVDLALYHLYSQTGSKDVPEHRSTRYQDAIDWLKDVGNGETTADLPELIDTNTGEAYTDFKLSSRTPEDHKW
jgi:hypothetical protein